MKSNWIIYARNQLISITITILYSLLRTICVYFFRWRTKNSKIFTEWYNSRFYPIRLSHNSRWAFAYYCFFIFQCIAGWPNFWTKSPLMTVTFVMQWGKSNCLYLFTFDLISRPNILTRGIFCVLYADLNSQNHVFRIEDLQLIEAIPSGGTPWLFIKFDEQILSCCFDY